MDRLFSNNRLVCVLSELGFITDFRRQGAYPLLSNNPMLLVGSNDVPAQGVPGFTNLHAMRALVREPCNMRFHMLFHRRSDL